MVAAVHGDGPKCGGVAVISVVSGSPAPDRPGPYPYGVTSDAEQVPLGPVPHVPAAEQARRQGVRPIQTVEELVFPGVWESDEELDEFLADLYASRRAALP